MTAEQTDLFTTDEALLAVESEFRLEDPDGLRWARVIRETYDQVYQGSITGRFRWDQLMKTEKTHFGSLFEINAQREFGFKGGDATDFEIAGYEVDAKWSQKDGSWMLPPEVFDKIALVATGSDQDATWSLGLVRVTEANRRASTNRDAKSQLSPAGKKAIKWLWRNERLRPNILLQLPPTRVDMVFAPEGRKSAGGTRKLEVLFKEAEGHIVHRNSVATVAQQLDHQKRLRYNGGARDGLQKDGYLLLSGKYHKEIARGLDVEEPLADEYISVRVVPAENGQGVRLGARWWRRAKPDEPITEPAPRVDEKSSPS
ncbi:NaeI family type II restriction endonuclease [Nesterenkonia populi]